MKKKATKQELIDLANKSIIKSMKDSLIGEMKPEAFVYWLQGFIELEDPKTLDKRQTQIIKDHLNLVLNKVTPDSKKKIEIKPRNQHKHTGLLRCSNTNGIIC